MTGVQTCALPISLVYVDDEGNPTDYDDVFLRLDRYAKHCREVGLGDDYVRSLIR